MWYVSLSIQILVFVLVVRQLWWPWRSRRWLLAWGALGIATGLVLLRRVYTLLWPYVDFACADITFDHLERSIPLLHSLASLLGFWWLTRLFPWTLATPAPAPAIITIDAASRVLTWDAHATDLFGWTAREMVGQSLHVVIPEPHRARHDAALARMAAATPPSVAPITFDTDALHKDGSSVLVQVTATPLPQEDGTVQFHGAVWRLVRA